tara:strand:+ start:280 stop:1023 length:744 start_codon:yes stop_codon:yes gene_type:complete
MQVDTWNPILYEDSHSYVWKLGADLVNLCDLKEGMSVLDLGCGTGHLTHQIHLSSAKVIGIDISQRMITQAKKNYPHLEFIRADATKLNLPEQFDVVFSNATLHWIKQSESVVEIISQSLKPSGKLVAEFGGKGNVWHIIRALSSELGQNMINPWYFPSVSEYSNLLEKHGLEVKLITMFDRPTPLEQKAGLRSWLDMFCKPIFANIDSESQDQICRKVEKQLRSKLYKDGRWVIDYRRLRVVAVKL